MKVQDDGREVDIPELSEEEAGYYPSLGTAIGIDEGHCLMLALRHCKGFSDRVIGYRKMTGEKGMEMTFYAEPSPRDWSPRKNPTRRGVGPR